MKLSICAGILFASLLPICYGKIWEIGISTNLQECYNQKKGVDVSTFVGSDHTWLCELMFTSEETQMNKRQINRRQTDICGRKKGAISPQEEYYQHLYDKAVEGGQTKCLRREYRMLTDTERDRFHNATNTLKYDTSIEPNKYDAIANIHPRVFGTAHGGPGFTGWHRIYLVMFETALREVDDSVCLPYWDSSLDKELGKFKPSPVWNENFFGAFENWSTPSHTRLFRQVGLPKGELIAHSAVEKLLRSIDDLEDHHSPVEKRISIIDELAHIHGRVHNYVGGSMADVTSPYDPVFFMHHAFVDYVWELFRTKLDYPEKYPETKFTKPLHRSSAPTCLGDSTQADGYKKFWTESYEYDDSPTCSAKFPECGSIHLTCLKEKGRCVPIDTEPTTNQPFPTQQHRAHPGHRQQRNIPHVQPIHNRADPGHTFPNTSSNAKPFVSEPNSGACSNVKNTNRYINSVQNDYCCDNICDIDQWATIPVKIVNVRPPKFNTYDSYPVKDGRVQNGSDIYDPSAYNETKKYISRPTANLETYSRCDGDEMVGEILLSSRGINYEGVYMEAAIVDNRLAASISTGFINVKKPQQGVTKALLRAEDSCGRVCQVACNDPKTGEYKKCSGAVAISNEEPLMYGNTYDEAVMNVFGFKSNKNFPSFKSDNFFITFYCDYHDEFPFVKDIPGQKQTPKRKVAKPEPVNDLPKSTSNCEVTKTCVIDQPCQTEKQSEGSTNAAACRGSCSQYAIRLYGQYFVRNCPEGKRFDSEQERCVLGWCPSTAQQ